MRKLLHSLQEIIQPVKDYINLQRKFFLNILNVDYIAKNNLNLGKRHFYYGSLSDAMMRFKGVIFLTPKNAEAYYYLGRCHLIKENNEQATESFQKCLELDSQFSQAKYFLSKMQSPDRIRQVNTELLKETLDYVAKDYAVIQKENGYQGDSFAYSLLKNHLTEESKTTSVSLLEVGCAGGLNTRKLKEKLMVNNAIGIDISEKIIETLEREVYNDELLYSELICSNPEDIIPTYKQQFNIVLAINFLQHYSSVDQLFRAISQSLKENGFFIATFSPTQPQRWLFNAKKDCFEHLPSYIKEEAKRYGLSWLENRKAPNYLNSDDEVVFFICQKQPLNTPTVTKKPQAEAK